ncbi:MAG: MMPL family transporter, partial [Gammaproteobacteria bacterium]|nr:MMPL family transporter [Gammaproteobacteria bacterium]
MKKILAVMSQRFEIIPDQVRRYRWLIWILFIIAMVGYGSGASRFQLDLTDEGFFSKSDPVRIAYNQFRAQFGGDDNIYLVYRALDGDIFSKKSLTAVRDLQEELLNYRLSLQPEDTSPLDHVVDIKTIINASYLDASDDSLIAKQFIGNNIPDDSATLEQIRKKAQAHPDYPLFYVSKDSTYGGILIRTDLGAKPLLKDENETEETAENLDQEFEFDDIDITDTDTDTVNSTSVNNNPEFEFVDPVQYQQLMHTITEHIEKPEYQQALSFHPVGNAVIHTYVLDVLFEQINMVMSLSIILIIAMLWFLFRSLSAVIWPVIIIGAASVLAIATLGWLELRMNMMVNITVFMILVVGVADSVHLLSGYIYYRNLGNDHPQSMRLTYKNAGMAILLTSVTTAIGMMSLFLVPIDAIQTFGFSAAIGVVFAFIVSVFMLPLMLDLWRPLKNLDKNQVSKGGKKHHYIQRILRKVEHLSHVNPNLNISIFTLIFIFFCFGLTKIEVDSNPMSLFKPDTPIVKDFNLVDTHMGGTQNIEVMIDMGQENALKAPAVLNAMESYQHYMTRTFPGEVLRTNSLVNIAKDANKSLNGGNDNFYSIPQDPRVLEQTLFLFNNANPSDRRLV